MKFLAALLVCLAPAWAQKLPNLPEETVVATFSDGATMTMGEFRRLLAVLPPDMQKQALENRPAFFEHWALMRSLAKMAQDEKLDQLSPAKDALEYTRIAILGQAKMDEAALQTAVLPSQVREFYDNHKDRYGQVRVKAIYIGFGSSKNTDADARAKAARIVAQARAGADFVKLVRENSDDAPSRAKDGEFLTLRVNDNVPDAVRNAIFKLNKGEVSDPVAQSNGYYIFRAEEVTARPFEEVRDEIFTQLKQQYVNEWIDKTRRAAKVSFNNLDFIGAVPMNTLPQK